MDYSVWSERKLKKLALSDGTVVWQGGRSDAPPLVIVHGTSGDHFGVLPLACELIANYQIFIVELAGHGLRDVPEDRSYSLRDMQADLLGQILEIEKYTGTKVAVVAHSFGCAVVSVPKIARSRRIIFITPVPRLGRAFFLFDSFVEKNMTIISRVYNWRTFEVLRRFYMICEPFDRDAYRRVAWNGRVSCPTMEQTVFQMELVNKAYRSGEDVGASKFVDAVIIGRSDTSTIYRTPEDFKPVFPRAEFAVIEGGHLVPIEQPRRVALEVKRLLVNF